MKHDTVRKRTRAVTLSLLVLATTSGVAAVEVIAASPAMVQPDGQSGGSAQEPGWDQPDPTPTSTSTPTPTPAPVPLPVPLPSVP
jgi:Spy/CpxP family protein refolding chaperone